MKDVISTTVYHRNAVMVTIAHHGGLLYDGVVGLLQVAVQDVTEHAGGILVQVAGSFSHTVVFAANRDVDALFLWGNNQTHGGKVENPATTTTKKKKM